MGEHLAMSDFVKDYNKCTNKELLEEGLCKCKYCGKVTDHIETGICPTCEEMVAHAQYNLEACKKIMNVFLKGEKK